MNGSSCNYKEVYDLLEELCINLHGSKHREILKNVTLYISNNSTAFGGSFPYDETALITKITSCLQDNSNSNSSLNDVIQFTSLYEKLKACQNDSQQRNASLSLLNYLANSNKSIMASNGFDTKTSSSKTKSDRYPTLNSVLSSVRSELFSDGEVDSKKETKSVDKLFSNQNRKVFTLSSSENNLTTSRRKISSTKLRSSDSSDSISQNYKSKSKDTTFDEPSGDFTDDLVQNVIYSFTGIQGKYLKKDVISGGFKLNPKARIIGVVQAGMMLRLSELGYCHDQVQSFADQKSGKCALGLMGQGFVSALKNELTKYYGMVAMLQEQLNKQRKKNPEEWLKTMGENITLMKVMVWAVDPLQRLQWLATIADACQEKKGGALASIIYEYLNNGDPLVKSMARELLLAVCMPLIQMLSRWVLEGEIIDPHGEFFVECLSEVGADRLWHDKYRLRNNMLPTFISTDFANKILVIGKSINFLCEICQDKTPIRGRDELKECLQTNGESIFSITADTKLHSTIDTLYLSTSKKVLDIVTGPHKLLDHLHAMRRYLLLGQGDFISILIENLKFELDKPGKELYCYDLSSIMDAAIRSTNAQYDDPEILNYLDVRLLLPYDGDTGWDILSLQYTVHGPLSTMLEPCMYNYQLLFKPLWKMKHVEFLLSSKIWKDQMCNAKPLRSLGNILNPIMYRLHLYASEMIHFIHQMQYYILFEVIECSWAAFLEKTQQAKTLDDILHAHDEFLETIKIGAFLDEKSNDLSSHMQDVYSGITKLETWQDIFFEICFNELNAQKQFKENIKRSEIDGKYGVTVETRLQRDEEHKIFELYIANCQKGLEKIGEDYEIAVRQFLLTLNSNNDLNLQLFGIRLDFNEYYKKRDQRLCVPLTFEHMRMSNVHHNSSKNNMSTSRY